MSTTEFGILIKAIDQATNTLRSVQGEIDRVKNSTKAAGDASDAASKLNKTLADTLDQVRQKAAATSPAMGAFSQALQSVTEATGLSGVALAGATAGIATLVATAGAASAAMVSLTQDLADYGRTMKNASDETGLTMAQLAGLRVASEESGRDFDRLQMGLFRFSDLIGKAADPTSQAAKQFRDLGIEVHNLDGTLRPAGDILSDVETKLKNTANANEKAAIASELFGVRTGAAMIPVLALWEEGTEKAKEMGLVLDPQLQEASDNANKAFKDLGEAIKGLKLEMGGFSAAFVTPIVQGLATLTTKVTEFLNSPAGLFLQGKQTQTFAKMVEEWALHQPGVSVTPGHQPGSAAADPGTDQKLALQEQHEALLKLIDDADKLRAIGAIGFEQEIQKLQTMKEQAKTRQDVLDIENQIARTREKEIADYKQQITSGRMLAPIPTAQGKSYQPTQFQYQPQYLQATETLSQVGEQFSRELSKEPMVEFLSKFGQDFQKILEKSTTTVGQVSETLVGFNGEMDRLKVTSVQFGIEMAHTFHDVIGHSVAQFVDDVFHGTKKIGQLFTEMFDNIAKQLIEQTISQLVVKLIFSAAAAGAGAQSGGTITAQSGGTMTPLYAQSGLIVSGMRGHDTVPIMAGRGETVLSHALTDQLRRFLDMAPELFASRQTKGQTVNAPTINVTANGHFVDRRSLQEFASETLIPIVTDALSRGSVRAAG